MMMKGRRTCCGRDVGRGCGSAEAFQVRIQLGTTLPVEVLDVEERRG